MARLQFGGGPEDVYLVEDEDSDLQPGGGATVLFYSTETGPNPITDMTTLNDTPITYITTSAGTDGRAAGQIPPFMGPDEVYEMWASANGSPRFLMQASNLGSYLGPTKDELAEHMSQHNGHATVLQDLGNVDATTVGAAADGQVLAYDATGGLWKASTAGSGSAPSNMATTNTAQTVSALKTFTGGLVAKPATVTGQAQITQALASQSGNVEEWRDSTGAAKAWMNSDFALRAPNLAQIVTFAKAGAVSAGAGTMRWYNDGLTTLTILSVRLNVGTASTSGTPTVDVNIDGVTAFATQANRPKVAVSGFTSGKVTNYTTTTIAPGSYLSADIDVAGTGTQDLVLQIALG